MQIISIKTAIHKSATIADSGVRGNNQAKSEKGERGRVMQNVGLRMIKQCVVPPPNLFSVSLPPIIIILLAPMNSDSPGTADTPAAAPAAPRAWVYLCCFILAVGWVLFDMDYVSVFIRRLSYVSFKYEYYGMAKMFFTIVTYPVIIALLLFGKRLGWIFAIGTAIFTILYQPTQLFMFTMIMGPLTLGGLQLQISQIFFCMLYASLLFPAAVRKYFSVSKLLLREMIIYSVVFFAAYLALYIYVFRYHN
jgi:hypothetical protein